MTRQNPPQLVLFFYFVAFAACAAVILYLLPGLISNVPAWSMTRPQLLVLIGLIGGFLATATLVMIGIVRQDRSTWTLVVAASAIIYAAIFLFLVNRYVGASSATYPAVFLVSILLVTLIAIAARHPLPGIAVIAVVAAGMVLQSDLPSMTALSAADGNFTSNTRTAYYNLKISNYEAIVPPSIRGGAIASYHDRYLVVTGDGRLYDVGLPEAGDVVDIVTLPISIPMNALEFVTDVGDRADERKFHLADIALKPGGDRTTIFASHHYWDSDGQCFFVRLSSIDVPSEFSNLTADDDNNWKTRFDSTPCLPLKSKGHAFGGHQSGGRLAFLDDEHLLMTVGDHTFDGNGSPRILPQDSQASYGKTIELNLSTGETGFYSTGHRNAQGLYVDPAQTVWLTEHGPRGGDELNRIVRDGNFGWPYAIHGTSYGAPEWPVSRVQDSHEGFEAPIFAWLPSIGISNLVGIEKELFPLWKGNLLISSLKGRSILRTKIVAGQAVYFEPIEIGKRIRDIIEAPDGTIVLWTDDESIVTIAPSFETDTGEALFAQCFGCHEINDGGAHGIGPDLRGTVGRPIAEIPGFEFSSALRNVNGEWDRETLDAFLEDPQTFAPGNAMEFAGMPDAELRSKLIDYLEANP